MPPTNKTYGAGWKTGDASAPEELELPSGATCLVRRLDPVDMVAAGIIDNMDVLTSATDTNLVRKATFMGEEVEIPPTEALVKMVEMADRITVAAVVEPTVRLAPIPACAKCDWEGVDPKEHGAEGVQKKAGAKYTKHKFVAKERDPEIVYTDGVPLGDKNAIMNWVLGGAQAVAPFPGEPEADMAPTPPSRQVRRATKRPAGNRRPVRAVDVQ